MINNLKDTLGIVRGANPADIEQLDKAERAKADAAAAEAKRLAELQAKVAKAMPERVQGLIDDYVGREQDALRAAAEALAREQLEAQYGLVDPKVVAYRGTHPRLNEARIENQRKRLYGGAAVPWDKQHRSGAQVASATAREAATGVDDVDARIAERKQMLAQQAARKQATDAARQTANEQRKRAAGLRT